MTLFAVNRPRLVPSVPLDEKNKLNMFSSLREVTTSSL
jgi:hypothetical protein